ncbi:efflux RND transporter permease subunit [Candidatus Omnitrophota bacterium]
MKLAEFSVKNSLLVNLISGFIIIVGIIAMVQLRREAFPPVDFDAVIITTVYPGASPEDVEKLVTTPIEKELKGISGIKEMTSKSEEGISSIGIDIDPDARAKEKVVDDIQKAVDRVRNLPSEIEEDPTVFELTADEFPIIELSIGGNFSEREKHKYAEQLEDLILEVEGVANVRRIGWRDREYWVEVDPNRLKEYHVSIDEIILALRSRNIALPGGQLTTATNEFNVRITGEFTSVEEIGEVVIRANDAGNWLKIKDVARVSDTFEDEDVIAKINGERSVSMVVVKNKTGDILKIVDKVKETIAQFEKGTPEGMEVITTNDFSYYVKRRLKVVQTNGAIGLVLVLVVLFLFLDPIPALMTAIGLPIALFTTFAVMLSMGATINLVTMLALIIVLGMLVDDGIIVAENVYRYIEDGMTPKDAAIKGTSEVIAPVTATILTTCAAFSPFLFMQDLIGRFIRFIPIVVMIALGASLFEAFIILPSHLSDFVKVRRANGAKRRSLRKDRPWYKRLVAFYTKVLKGALAHRYKVLLGMSGIFVAVIVIAGAFMKIEMWGGEGIEYFFVRAEAKKGTPLEELNRLIAPVEDLMATIPDTELDSYRTYLGSIETERHFDPNAKKGTHLGQIRVFLTPSQHRKRRPEEITESLRPALEKIEGFEKLTFFREKEGPPQGQPVEVGIKGDDFEVSQKIAGEFIDALSETKGVSDIVSAYEFGKKQLRVKIDEEKAKKYFLTVGQIASTVRSTFRGGVATTVKPTKAEEEINVVVRFSEEDRSNLNAFDKILVANTFGNLIPLQSVATIEETEGVFKIDHLDGKRVIMVTAQVDNKNVTSLKVNNMLKEKFKDISQRFPGYTVHYGGEYEDQMEMLQNLLRAFLIAFLLIFIILAAIFNSLIQPILVLFAIPAGMIGVLIAFMLHDFFGKMFFGIGRPLSFFAFMGLVGLLGIVVNDSIVLVDFVNKLRKSGKDRTVSLIEAGQMRMRPVIMTSVTTIAGLVSVAYGIGGGDPFLKPMGLAIIWGLFFSTGFTLVVIPCLYAIIDDISLKLLKHESVKKNHNDHHNQIPPKS